VTISGSGDVNATGLKEAKVAITIKGSGDVKLAGAADELSVDVAGSGDVDSRELAAKRADVNVRGSGDVKVRADESLHAAVRGTGDVRYTGNPPEVVKEVSGIGSVRPM
jgi:hypothetical protein